MRETSAAACTLFVLAAALPGAIRPAFADPPILPPPSTQPEPVRREKSPSRLGFEIGSFSPAANPVPTADSHWVALQLNLSLQSPRSQNLFQPGLLLDVAGNGGQQVGVVDGTKVSIGRALTGLCLAERARIPLSHGGATLSFGAGGGVYNVRAFERYDYTGNSNNNTNQPPDGYSSDYNWIYSNRYSGPNYGFHTLQTGYRMGYHLSFDVKGRGGAYLQAGWIDAGKMGGLYYRGSTLAIGYRL